MDVDITKMTSNDMAKFRNNHFGFIFQFYELLYEFNVIENIIIPGLIAKQSKNKL